MVTEAVAQVQAEDTQTAARPGSPEASQVAVAPVDVQASSVTEPQGAAEPKTIEPKEKSYTQAEVEAARAEVMSAKDKEIAERNQLLARIAFEQQIREAQAAEAQTQAKDRADVESGFVGEDEVKQRQQARQYTQQLRQEVQQIAPVVQHLYQEGNRWGMVASVGSVVDEIAKEDKLNPYEAYQLFDKMMSGEKLTHPEQVKTKAASIKLAKVQEALRAAKATPEHFATAQVSGTPSEDQGLKSRYPTMFKK